jgi:hypothetical protein
MTVATYPAQVDAVRRSGAYTALLRISLPILMLVSVYGASRQLTPNESVFSMRNGFGPVIQSIVQQHRLGAINRTYGWWCYAGRMPIVPVLGAASYWLSPRMAVFLFLKNLVFWTVWIYAFFRLKRHYSIPDKWALVAVLLLLLAPYNLSTAGQLEVEEGFLFALMALLFSLILTIEGSLTALAAGLIMATIYLTKSSMLPLCLATAAWIVIRCWKKGARIVLIPLLVLALAILGWGSYVRAVTGVFAVGADTSSWNGWNFYKGNNPYANSLYPRVILDVLDHESYAHDLLPFVPVHNEWELSHAQLALGEKYVRDNPSAVLTMDLKKLYVACCDLGESPEATVGHTRVGIILSNGINHLSLACVLVVVLVNAVRRRVSDAEILAILLAFAYVLPYFAGFLYMRHMVPVYGLMALTASVQVSRWNTQMLGPHTLLIRFSSSG